LDSIVQCGIHIFELSAKKWYQANHKKINSWRHLVVMLKERFLPEDSDFWLSNQIDLGMQKPSEKITVYISDMELLFKRLKVERSAEQKLQTLVRNLHSDYSEKLPPEPIKTIDQLERIGILIENRRNAAKRSRFVASTSNVYTRNAGRIAVVQTNMEDTMDQPGTSNNYQFRTNNWNRQTQTSYSINNQEKCFNCEENGHRWKECAKPKRIFCYRCGKLGFFTKYCECQTKNN
jgi:hypothetical protein